jgi:hypothetical protein
MSDVDGSAQYTRNVANVLLSNRRRCFVSDVTSRPSSASESPAADASSAVMSPDRSGASGARGFNADGTSPAVRHATITTFVPSVSS